MNLIPDSELIKIPVEDNGEELVDLREFCPGLEFAISDPELDDRFYLARKTIAEKLNNVIGLLKAGESLVIFSAYRPMAVQKAHYEAMLKKVAEEHTDWNELEIKEETAKRIAPPDIIPPHTTGGAIDLTISRNGDYLDMGTAYKEFNGKTQTDSDEITNEQKTNRTYLFNLMTNAGFINYPTEWWHYSYGDRYWAAATSESISIYNSK